MIGLGIDCLYWAGWRRFSTARGIAGSKRTDPGGLASCVGTFNRLNAVTTSGPIDDRMRSSVGLGLWSRVPARGRRRGLWLDPPSGTRLPWLLRSQHAAYRGPTARGARSRPPRGSALAAVDDYQVLRTGRGAPGRPIVQGDAGNGQGGSQYSANNHTDRYPHHSPPSASAIVVLNSRREPLAADE